MLADYISRNLKNFPDARTFVMQEQSIKSGGGPSVGLPVQFVLQAPNFEKLKQYLPLFLEEANKNPVFQGVDVNLKFNKPELVVTIDRERAKSLGISATEIGR